MNIIEAVNSERIFKPLFRDLRTWGAWNVFLKALFGLPIPDRNDLGLFRKCTGLKAPSAKRAKEAYVIAGRRSGKSFISSVISVYLALFHDWKPYLSTGEKGWIFIIATDRAQAKIIKNYVSGILNSSPLFRRAVKKELRDEIELENGIIISIKTCDFRSVRGYTCLGAILEELAFWRDEQSANPDTEVLTALRPSLSTVPDSLLLGISTPYSRSGVLWEMYRKRSERGAALTWQAPTRVMNPTISKKLMDDALKEDYAAGKAEWLAEFREDIESFLPLELIEQAVIPGRIELSPLEGITYHGFCDPSGGRQDSMTLAIAHKDSNTSKVVLDCLREARPPFVPKEVVQDFSQVLKSYGVTQVESDRYAAEWVNSSFRDHSIMIENSELPASEIYLNFLPLISNGSVELLDSKRLVSQLRGLERRARSGGKDLVAHYPGGHDDLANAAAGACVLASKIDSYRLPSPSLGLVEKSKKRSLDDESVNWLLDRKPKKKEEEEEISDEELLREMEEEDERQESEGIIKRWK